VILSFCLPEQTICRGKDAPKYGARTGKLKLLPYNPDHEVTQSFLPYGWRLLTPRDQEVVLIDGRTRPMNGSGPAPFADDKRIRGCRHWRKDPQGGQSLPRRRCIRTADIPVVMGGPLVTALPGAALGRDDGPRQAGAVAGSEADETWPLSVEDAARGGRKEIDPNPATPLDVALVTFNRARPGHIQ
jgi:hypothetical protein